MASLLRRLPQWLMLVAMGPLLAALPAAAQQQGYGQTMEGASGSGGASSLGGSMGKSSSVLDAVNPIDLMNKIRRNQALDDATPPGDAVDQALRDYQGQVGTPAPAASLKGP
ncbi:MAG: hypothetical protein VKM98_10630 [Cyanobacteriota bacterium]|nr:hypothetical protein [Cyanobacteriota bacterium]